MSDLKSDDILKRSPGWSTRQVSTNTTLLNSPNGPYNSPRFLESEDQRLGNAQTIWDELGFEASEHATIWHLYNDESAKADASTTDGFNRGIDVLLVFTGLFSAVVTTFIIQSYQQMLPDSTDTTNALLSQLIADLRDSLTLNITKAPISLPTQGQDLVPSPREIRWVNGLWFAALSCSLSAALVSMLAKQWIQPIPNVSGSPRFRVRKRQQRHTQLQHWHVFAVVNALPLLLHVALLLFFGGVIVLLWSGDAAITASTFTIVSLAYIFYMGSMVISLIYPDCPYQHPYSEHLRHWITRQTSPAVAAQYLDLEHGANEELKPTRIAMAPSTVKLEDCVDASALLWLIQQSSNEGTIAAALQSIGGLPKEFTAFHVLRDAGAIPLVLQHFSSCFHRELSFDQQWHVIDSDEAERYCRAWIRLTHGTSAMWPRNLQAPLEVLKESTINLHTSAVAACTIALNSLESRTHHLTLIHHLSSFVNGESNLSEVTQRWVLDTFLECSLSWELRAAVVEDIARRAVPVLLRLLQRGKDTSSDPNNRTTIALILSSLTIGNLDPTWIWREEKSILLFHYIMIPVLAHIIRSPVDRYGVKDEVLDFAVAEFSGIAAPAFTRSNIFPRSIKEVARQTLSKLYLEGRVGLGLVPDPVLADILQILHPPANIAPEQKPWFVKILLRTLKTSTDINVAIGCTRLLEPLLTDCSSGVIRTFTEENGIEALLHAAHTGDIDSRRLQNECIRTLCVFIRSSTACYSRDEELCPSHSPSLDRQFDVVFRSNFFKILINVVETRPWWLAEIAEIWLPSLICLYQIRPDEQVWERVEVAFRKFAGSNIGEEGVERMFDMINDIQTTLTLNNLKEF